MMPRLSISSRDFRRCSISSFTSSDKSSSSELPSKNFVMCDLRQCVEERTDELNLLKNRTENENIQKNSIITSNQPFLDNLKLLI